MCGICGVLSLRGDIPDPAILARMVDAIRHRGPDDSGYQVIGPCGLGNTRLAIIDLSAAGHQPMQVTQAGREVWIAYNGEAYNFEPLRAALAAEGRSFKSRTDTETLAQAYLKLGAPEFIEPFRGMFGLAIWDTSQQRLLLLRDRLGKKPLYYTLADGWLVFGSEIKALLAHPAVQPRFNQGVLHHYLAYGYPPPPETFYEGIFSLPPGHMLNLDLRRDRAEVEISAYWEPPRAGSAPDPETEAELVSQFRDMLRESVQLRMISDVPLGAFLSGGLDSAAVVALMAEASSQPVRTFSIGFAGEKSFDETPFAAQVAQRFGAKHETFIVEPKLIELVETLLYHHDQPFGDSSAIPTYMVSKLARTQVTVALNGDGGDEILAGYDRFRAAQIASDYTRMVPPMLRRLLNALVQRLPESTNYGGIVRRARRFLGADDPSPFRRYLSWIRYVPAPWLAALMSTDAEHLAQYNPRGYGESVNALLDFNLHGYLPEDLLVKADRSSMAVSLEARSPFLDHRLVEFTHSLPLHWKLRGGQSKYLLKQAMRGLLPDTIIDRKKHGFGVPLGAWFRGDLAGYARAALWDSALAREGLLKGEALRAMLETHQRGQADLGGALWTLLTLELWYRQRI